MATFFISKHRERFVSKPFLDYVRGLPCCVCGAPATASHMVSKKLATGSDVLAVPACMPTHHVQSTRSSREILERYGINVPELQIKTWMGFCATLFSLNGVDARPSIDLFLTNDFDEMQHAFEEHLIENDIGARNDGSKRKNRKK